jgi:cytochrome c oxidase subunit IV
MDAHTTTAAHEEHAHPRAALYAKVGLYEITYGEHAGPTASAIQPFFVPLLLLLSAVKFALVAMFYMHLKQDSKLFTGIFVFPLTIAAVIIVGLMLLMAYHMSFSRSG